MSKNVVKNLKFKKVDGFDYVEFSSMIDKAYNDRRRGKREMQKKTFSPSSIGYGHGNCPRYWFIAFNGEEFDEKFDATAIANMLNGTYAHDRIQKIIEETGTLKEMEREILSDDPPIRGFADVVLDWNDTEIIGEIKTTKEEQFIHRQSSMKPSPNHLLQILTYMKVEGASEGFLLYENKNTQEICVIPISMNERHTKIIDDTFDWMREVYSMYVDNIIPARGFAKTSYACANCPVKKHCWAAKENKYGDGEERVEVLVPPK
jgi:CRISPR/Cas system-associated exonuclease Cas4 (RecB family)